MSCNFGNLLFKIGLLLNGSGYVWKRLGNAVTR